MTRRNSAPIFPIAAATEELIRKIEALGVATRMEYSSASRGSAYIYVLTDDCMCQLKIRVSNHDVGKPHFWRAPDIELRLPHGRIDLVVEEVKARLRA